MRGDFEVVKDLYFIEKVKRELLEKLGEGFHIDVRKVLKNNGVELTGMVIFLKDSAHAKVIYLDSYYEAHCNGMPFHCVIQNMVQIYETSKEPEISTAKVLNFEEMRGKIVFRLINRNENQEFLKTVPHTQYLDLAVVFYLLLDFDEGGALTSVIHNELADYWNVTVSELMSIAMVNSPKLLPAQFGSMKHILQSGLNIEDDVERFVLDLLEDDSSPMYVLRNASELYGAGVIMYPGVLQKIANAFDSDLVILPCSVHECIIVKYDKDMDLHMMQDKVRYVNQTEVPKEDVLGDSVYVFWKRKETIDVFNGKCTE